MADSGRGFTMIKPMAGVLAAAAALTMASPAAAVLVGAATIRVTNAVPTWLQIGEVIATSTGNINVALGGSTATSPFTNVWGGGSAAVAVDGVYPVDYPNIWHSDTDTGVEFLEVTFAGGPANLKGITIYGRSPCCENYNLPERDIYNVTVFNGQGETLWSGVLDASLSETASASVSFVPEPESWAMLIAGFGLVGATMRRRARATVTA
jgi:hypothetical protein